MPNVTVSLPDELLKKARAAAEGQFRSLSQHVSFLIIQDAESRDAALGKAKALHARVTKGYRLGLKPVSAKAK